MHVRSTMKMLAVTAAFFAVPAVAQEGPADNILEGDNLTVGVGAVYVPSYRGSDDYVVSPVPLVRGKFKGIDINPRVAGVALDFIPDNRDSKIGFNLGPVATYSGNRANRIKDPVVRAAGKLDPAVEVGANAGISAYRLLNEYDSLTLSADVKWDVAGAHKGMTINPAISYATPLSKAILAVAAVSARHVDDDFAEYYYSVNPGQSARSGLPGYRASGGWDSVNISILMSYDFSGDVRNGGWSVFGVANYSRMLNDAKNTPYTSLRGDADQWVFGAGLAYTF